MSLFSLDDTTFDATRKSIFFYSIMSFLVFLYEPTFDLNSALKYFGLKVSNVTLSPRDISIPIGLALTYLFFRLIVLTPIYAGKRKSEHGKLGEEAQDRYNQIEEQILSTKGKIDTLSDTKQIHNIEHYQRQFLSEEVSEEKIMSAISDIETIMDSYNIHMPKKFDLESSGIGLKSREHQKSEIYKESSIGDREKIDAQELKIEKSIIKETLESLPIGRLSNVSVLLKNLQETRAQIPLDPTASKAIVETQRAAENFQTNWHAFLETTKTVPKNYKEIDTEAGNNSDFEVLIFARVIPLIALSLGYLFCVKKHDPRTWCTLPFSASSNTKRGRKHNPQPNDMGNHIRSVRGHSMAHNIRY